MRNKESALKEYMEMTKQSWTYSRMTEEERRNLFDALRYAYISGSFDQRWKQLQSIGYAFLLGIGYKPIGWRESEEAPKF